MDNETKSITALNQFRKSLSEFEEYGFDGVKFKGVVTYKALGKEVSEVLEVLLITGGFEPLVRLDISESGNLITIDDYHLDFNPRFSKSTQFEFDSSTSTFIIKGTSSPKIGNYTVLIKEA